MVGQTDRTIPGARDWEEPLETFPRAQHQPQGMAARAVAGPHSQEWELGLEPGLALPAPSVLLVSLTGLVLVIP